jgi:hypothetical protein
MTGRLRGQYPKIARPAESTTTQNVDDALPIPVSEPVSPVADWVHVVPLYRLMPLFIFGAAQNVADGHERLVPVTLGVPVAAGDDHEVPP